ncbi:MAG: DUF6090 family protein [Flavobacteriaceae bacterium]
MIKFFRKIRRRLLSENKFSQYIFYAIGEIVLVVIGILIALQINNYSESSKIRKQEISLLKNLNSEIKLDILQIQNNATSTSNRLKKLDSLIQQLERPTEVDRAQFIQESFDFVIDNYFKSNSGIFDEAVSSGRMSFLQNEKLRQHVFDYYRNAEENSGESTTRLVTDELITPIFVETLFINPEGFSSLGLNVQNISYLDNIDLEELRENKEFWKMVLLKFGSNREQLSRLEQIRNLAEEVSREIERELEKIE